MIKVFGGAHAVATLVLNGAYDPIDQYKQCGNERRDDYDNKPQSILGCILLSEDLGPRKVACQLSQYSSKFNVTKRTYQGSSRCIAPKTLESA